MQSIASRIVKDVRKQRKSKGDIMLLKEGAIDCPRITTQCAILDAILGGGMPLGRIVEIYGNEGSGKTTVALHLLAAAQEIGGVAAMIDVEHALRPSYAETIVPDYANLMFSQPNSGEQALEIAQQIMEVKTKLAKTKPLVIVVDSAAALASERELAGELSDHHYAPVAVLLSQSLRRMRGVIGQTQTLFIFTNQVREGIGPFSGPPKSTGGRALKFYSTIRLEVKVGKKLRKNDEFIGQMVKARVAKNKTYPPFKEAEFRLIYNQGIDIVHSLFTVALANSVVVKNGSWYEFGRFKAQGVNAFVEKLREDSRIVHVMQRRLGYEG